MSKLDRSAVPPPSGGQRPPQTSFSPNPVQLRSSKIQGCHLERWAIVYVRQSTPQQIHEHRESRERQYALADYAVTLGWPKERVEVMDEDQGHSGKNAEQRSGFHRLLAEVTMRHVGLVLGLEMSRLARSNKDWHHLLEVCALFGTLLADQDGVYDPRDSNDRLLLGLKGTMSEFELVTMRNRLDRGRLHKAERGELFLSVPAGYVRLPTEEVVQDPDEQVRAVVALIFDKFAELGSMYAVFHYLLRHHLSIGGRVQRGPRRGQVEWRRPTQSALLHMLHHPIYAGAYAYGWLPPAPTPHSSGSPAGPPRQPEEEWQVLKRDHLPAYISWARYLENRQRLAANRSGPESAGVARHGPALLAGVVVCGRCGLHLRPFYRNSYRAYYMCVRHLRQGTERVCAGSQAGVVDDLVVAQVLRALEPAALELSLQATQDIQQERARLDRHWQQRLEQARYETDRALRQYDAVEPENRLVARTLERRWEEALRQQRHLEEEYDRFTQEQPLGLTPQERERVLALSADLPALWQAPGTTVADRKAVIRCLVERVVIQAQQGSNQVGVIIHWKGGSQSVHQVRRPVARYELLDDYEELIELVVWLRAEGHPVATIAARLNEEGFCPPRQAGPFTREIVSQLLHRRGLAKEMSRAGLLRPGEWWLAELGRELGVPAAKLRDWILRGWLHGRQTPVQGLWVAWADGSELQRLRQLRDCSQRGVTSYPKKLTTPKKRKTK
jgi:DNA invertase Pin-like site-specific DNA recombinase